MARQLTDDELAIIATHFANLGREMATIAPTERRRMVSTIVRAIGEQCPAATADLAACAGFTLLLGGDK